MGNLLLSEVPSDILAEKVAEIVINRIKGIIPLPPKKDIYISRKKTAELLEVTGPTVDNYTREGLLKKYGKGIRGKYIEEEVEAAKPLIYSNKHKKRKL
jgi:hypothetical protein